MINSINQEDRISPYQLDAQGQRKGHWVGQEWAKGFHLAASANGTWQALATNAQHYAMLQPVILYQNGFNSENPEQQIDDDNNLLATLIESLRDIHDFARLHQSKENPALAQAQPTKDVFKIGASEPCLCGSGKKYRKCCGVPEAVAAA